MVLGWLKGKLHFRRRKEDLPELRSEVLREMPRFDFSAREETTLTPSLPPPPPRALPSLPRPREEGPWSGEELRPRVRPELAPIRVPREIRPTFEGLDRAIEETRERGFERSPASIASEIAQERKLFDELAFIKEQLSAIKAQVETINERLKNLEHRLGYR